MSYGHSGGDGTKVFQLEESVTFDVFLGIMLMFSFKNNVASMRPGL